ncbi:tRNA(fMet)-specific endonuclease VapC [Gemmata sp. SH-PL17]|uniref:type II toxin-antitoxin system VapC family toxin n=1 Tax=Gemmata sp. SH-PL17 TaxID=1630693 RepID=UPI00078D8378|nr:type II toxin-antitoxin system VapC family toxin [Gemmata sp. SH-PL17]AMV24060.1 tRNA(fMet)-specific endonuclease VapC [Gemmata sp. SH-PL17]
MSSCVLDASALIAFLFGEPGADVVAARIPGGLVSAVNLSEVAARALEKGMPLDRFDYELGRLPLTVVPFDTPLAKVAATLRVPTRPLGLSFADRACLALCLDRGLPAVTGDRDWTKVNVGVEIVVFR